MKDRLRIHHGVGSRVLLDSERHQVAFTYAKDGEHRWRFVLESKKTPEIVEVLRLKNEVNVFIFKEEDGVAKEKSWFYTGDGQIEYDENSRQLEIVATSVISYHPGDFEP